MSKKKHKKIGLTARQRRMLMTDEDVLKYIAENSERLTEEGKLKLLQPLSDGMYIKSDSKTTKFVLELLSE